MSHQNLKSTIRSFVTLTKPGIIAGNLISLASAFLLGAHTSFYWTQIALLVTGAALVIASGCAINNAFDRDIDALMIRTRRRPMVDGAITVRAASIFAVCLVVVGSALFYSATESKLALGLLILGYVIYAGIYTFFMKRRSVHGTLIGSIAGAMPPVAGYCAAKGTFDGAALILLAIFSIWQMPHSYAIAIFRKSDYQAASIPVLPVMYGTDKAKHHMLWYMAAFMLISPSLSVLGYAGNLYFFTASVGSAYWLWLGFQGFRSGDEKNWARKVFFTSIVLVTVLCLSMAGSAWLA
jgi:protoheme IX farnesyltransferase